MPNSKEHRLSNINKPNTVGNPNRYMHLDYSNPLGSRDFRSVIRGSATGAHPELSNRQPFVVRDIDARKRWAYEEAKGRKWPFLSIMARMGA